jgi:hypothetical protein
MAPLGLSKPPDLLQRVGRLMMLSHYILCGWRALPLNLAWSSRLAGTLTTRIPVG